MTLATFRLAGIALLAGSLFAQTSAFPTSADTDALFKVQVNGTQTSLTVNMTSGASSATVASCTGIVANTLATIDVEIIAVSGCTGTTLGVATTSPGCTSGRACDGTSAAAHTSGAAVSLFVDAWHHNSLRVAVETLQTALINSASVTFGALTTTTFVTAPAHNGNVAGLSGTCPNPTSNTCPKTFLNSDGSYSVDYQGNVAAQNFNGNYFTWTGQTSPPSPVPCPKPL